MTGARQWPQWRNSRRCRRLHQVDCYTDPAYDPVRALNPSFVAVHTTLHVPMLKEGRLLGAIVIYRDKVLAFDDKEVELVENFAKQAVIAIENTRLITETREALEQQQAIAEVLQVINSSPGDLAPVFDAILEKAHSLCGAELGSLVTYDGEQFRALTTLGYPEEYAAVLRQPFPPSTFHRALMDGERFVHIADTAAIEWVPGNASFRRPTMTHRDRLRCRLLPGIHVARCGPPA